METAITERMVSDFHTHLICEEKSRNTVEKYLRDVRAFAKFTCGKEVSKATVIGYKERLLEGGFAVRSINSVLASLNSLFTFLGRQDCKVKTLKVQRQIFCPEEKELTKAEYERLCRAARSRYNERLDLILQTICGTGIRVSELPFITAEAVNCGEAVVSLKGKTRTVFLVSSLQKKLLRYIEKQKISSGAVFVTRTGRPMDRTNIWREMKSLCRSAGVDRRRPFPTICATCLRAFSTASKRTS